MSAVFPARVLSDGLDTWGNRTVTPFGVTYGNGTFVTVGVGGSIATSPDGVTWTGRNSGTDGLQEVTYGNGTFVVVGSYGTILQSGTISTTATTPTPTPASSPAPQPTPKITPSPTPVSSPPPPPSECTATSITASTNAITIKKRKRSSVTVTVTGDGDCDCAVKGEKVKAKVDASGKKMVSVTPSSAKTGEDGSATFTLKAKSRTGNTSVIFSTADGLSCSVDVKITK